MVYLDSSVALAHLLAEDRRPPEPLWNETLVSSRLLEYELWTRVHARRLADSHGDAVRDLLARVGVVELNPLVLERATESFPAPVRTLDALHLASLFFLRDRGQPSEIATYELRMRLVDEALDMPIHVI